MANSSADLAAVFDSNVNPSPPKSTSLHLPLSASKNAPPGCFAATPSLLLSHAGTSSSLFAVRLPPLSDCFSPLSAIPSLASPSGLVLYYVSCVVRTSAGISLLTLPLEFPPPRPPVPPPSPPSSFTFLPPLSCSPLSPSNFHSALHSLPPVPPPTSLPCPPPTRASSPAKFELAEGVTLSLVHDSGHAPVGGVLYLTSDSVLTFTVELEGAATENPPSYVSAAVLLSSGSNSGPPSVLSSASVQLSSRLLRTSFSMPLCGAGRESAGIVKACTTLNLPPIVPTFVTGHAGWFGVRGVLRIDVAGMGARELSCEILSN
ncbi:hypothetical protein TeGR_g7676 [Tetraparma gracilis]|uniref:Uncharacterized protein n=1 Tax=Tetraparma gracilis TaxID=2962635 RepID=A0ABQ6N2E8_9STRA|nr:hypothetical protein TeGR_g7676 [Tetraparma gracilis]